jgi:hypothetical protein
VAANIIELQRGRERRMRIEILSLLIPSKLACIIILLSRAESRYKKDLLFIVVISTDLGWDYPKIAGRFNFSLKTTQRAFAHENLRVGPLFPVMIFTLY